MDGGATLYDKSKNDLQSLYDPKANTMYKVDDGKSINWKNLLPYEPCNRSLSWIRSHSGLAPIFNALEGVDILLSTNRKIPHGKRFNTNDGRAKKVVSMAVDGEWAGLDLKGAFLYLIKKQKVKTFYSYSRWSLREFCQYPLSQKSDSLWMGTNAGISHFHKTKKKIWKTILRKKANRTRSNP